MSGFGAKRHILSTRQGREPRGAASDLQQAHSYTSQEKAHERFWSASDI